MKAGRRKKTDLNKKSHNKGSIKETVVQKSSAPKGRRKTYYCKKYTDLENRKSQKKVQEVKRGPSITVEK